MVGPLHDVSTNRQIGIVSHGAADCTSDSPSILTRVTDNYDYIDSIIGLTTLSHMNPQNSLRYDVPDSTQANPQVIPQINEPFNNL